MIYSVFNWQTGKYSYFTGPGEGLGQRPSVQQINDDKGHHKLEDLLSRVPAGSQPDGEGDEPKGRVAVIEGTASASGGVSSADGSLISGFGADSPLTTSPWLTLGLWAGGVLIAYRFAAWLGHLAAGNKPQ